jgi:hypothetical protein
MDNDGKVYKGARFPNGDALILAGKDEPGYMLMAARSLKVRNHSPDGFEWGYMGSGPAQLALALLLDITDDEEISVKRYQDFMREVIAQFTQDEWYLTEEQVLRWLALKEPGWFATEIISARCSEGNHDQCPMKANPRLPCDCSCHLRKTA